MLVDAPGYWEWQTLLEREFFTHTGPVILYIDDSELSRLASTGEAPGTDLASAVQELVDPALGRHMFKRVARLLQEWSRVDEAPPVLPLLALSVLAATRMRTDGIIHKSNYYMRLAQALSAESPAADPGAVRNALREGGAFDDVVRMWRELDAWLRNQSGARGDSTIKDDARLTRIGFPLSQAIIRASDREALTQFFSALEIKPDDVPSETELAGHLKLWTARQPRGFSEEFRRALSDEKLRSLASGIVHQLARTWDGRIRTGDGRLRLQLHLSLDFDDWVARWRLQSEDGPLELALSGPHGRKLELVREDGEPFYSSTAELPVESKAVRDGLRLEGSACSAVFSGGEAIVFRRNPFTGTWLSTRGIDLFEEHSIALSADIASEVKQALKRAASDPGREIPQRAPRFILEGFALIEGIRFDDWQRLESALKAFPALGKLQLAPEPAARPRLVNGLPLNRRMSHSCYLQGGEPDLLLPLGSGSRKVAVALDGTVQEFQATGFPIELRRFGPFETGKHVVEADGARIEFTVLQADPKLGELPGSGAYGWSADGVLVEDSAAEHRRHVARETRLPVPLLARRGKDATFILYEGGRSQRIAEPDPPRLLELVDEELRPAYFEIRPRSGARWLAQRRKSRWTLLSTDASDAASFDIEHHDIPKLWRHACTKSVGAVLWQRLLDGQKGPHDR